MLVRPSLVLQVKLKPEDYSEKAAEEITRSYIYMAQSIVSELGEDELRDGNIMRLSIRLMKPYWDKNDPKAQELWEGVMPQWLKNVTRNMSIAMRNYNAVDHPAGVGEVTYDWVDFDFGEHALLRVKPASDNTLPKTMPEMAEKARALICDGAFGNKRIDMVRMPSRESYELQLKAARDKEIAAAEEAPREDDGAFDPVSAGIEDALLDDGEAKLAAPTDDEATPDEPENVGDAEPTDGAAPSFQIDYRIWGIEFADGSSVELDSASV